MKTRHRITVLLTAGLLSLAWAPGVAMSEPREPAFAQDRASVTSRFENVERLVTTSSGARRVEQSGNADALALRDRAADALEAAQGKLKKGDMTGANEDLHSATEAMFAAIRLIGTGEAGEAKKQRDFEAKASSLDILVKALERVADEKGNRAALLSAGELRAQTERARQASAQGRADQARSILDAAYDDAKHQLEQLRNGETLVRTLSFANKEEEYHYELDRNDTHRMLLKVLLEDKAGAPSSPERTETFVAEAEKLRLRAEAEAKARTFDAAVRSLEESTKALQRAIRSAGIYIPG